MGSNIAMRRPGTQFSGDGLSLSWPLGGERQVVSFPPEKRTPRIIQRIAQGQIIEVNDEPTDVAGDEARSYRLLTGDEARAHKAEPAGPVVRFIYTREDGSTVNAESQLVDETDEYKKGQEKAAQFAAEQRQAEIDRQIAAEKEAAEADKPEDEPLSKEAQVAAHQRQAAVDKIALQQERDAAAYEKMEKEKQRRGEEMPKGKQTVVARPVETKRVE
jgi:hypothetical protein